MTIARRPVTSSAIRSIGHDPDTNTLAVEMTNGTLYHYADVEPHHFDALMGAESIGKHFGAHVRGKFTHTRIEQDAGAR